MRNISMFNHVSLDGYFEGENHDMSWIKHDQESNDFAKENLGAENTLLFGRVTYEMMASYWPTPAALRDNPIVADYMNKMPKFVVSNTLTQVEWQNSTILRGDIVEEIRKLKQLPGAHMTIFGSGKLVAALTAHQLIDEYQFMVNPAVLGKGTTLFKTMKQSVSLELMESRKFNNGCVLLKYRVKP
jgi:dihydrofolate reductase